MKKYVKSSTSSSYMEFTAKMINAIYSVVEEYADTRSLTPEQKLILSNSVDDIVEKLYSIIL